MRLANAGTAFARVDGSRARFLCPPMKYDRKKEEGPSRRTISWPNSRPAQPLHYLWSMDPD